MLSVQDLYRVVPRDSHRPEVTVDPRNAIGRLNRSKSSLQDSDLGISGSPVPLLSLGGQDEADRRIAPNSSVVNPANQSHAGSRAGSAKGRSSQAGSRAGSAARTRSARPQRSTTGSSGSKEFYIESARVRVSISSSNNNSKSNSRVGSAHKRAHTDDTQTPITSVTAVSEPGEEISQTEISRPQTASPTGIHGRTFINSPQSELQDLINADENHSDIVIPTTQSEPYANTSGIVDSRSEPGAANTPTARNLLMLNKRSVTSFSEPAQYAAARGFCVRSRSALLRETDGLVNSLSRQCCDVLGPRMCHQCALLKRRERDNKRFEAFLPRVEMTAQNLTMTLLIAKNNPSLSLEEIQAKVARGEVSKPAFRSHVHRLHERQQKDIVAKQTAVISAWQSANNKKKQGKLLGHNGPTYNYFKSVKDLNKKITEGAMVRRIILTGDETKDKAPLNPSTLDVSQVATSFSEAVNPSFISARRPNYRSKTANNKRPVALYEPPLLPLVCQNAEPAFFAGKQTAYTLPSKPQLAYSED